MLHPYNLSFTSPRLVRGSVGLKAWTTLTLLLLSLNALIVPEANAQGDAGQVFGKMIDLFQELKRQKREPTVRPVTDDQAPQTPPLSEGQSPYKIGDFRLGQQNQFSGFTKLTLASTMIHHQRPVAPG